MPWTRCLDFFIRRAKPVIRKAATRSRNPRPTFHRRITTSNLNTLQRSDGKINTLPCWFSSREQARQPLLSRRQYLIMYTLEHKHPGVKRHTESILAVGSLNIYVSSILVGKHRNTPLSARVLPSPVSRVEPHGVHPPGVLRLLTLVACVHLHLDP